MHYSAILPFIRATCLGVLLVGPVLAASQNENCLPFLSGMPDQTTMQAPPKTVAPASKTWILPATPATTQWGVFDSAEPPVLTIRSGDSVIIETMAASDNQVVPGTTSEQIIEVQTAVQGRGPHTLTGPVYVEDAEPGDTLRIHFNRIVPRAYASNNTAPGKGLFPKEFPEPHVKYFYLDLVKKQMQFAPGIMIPIAPFPGVVAVAQATPGKYSSGPPGSFGGNMDLREMTEGSTLYLPVFMKGALLWTGDSHAGQGNGEIDLTAMETAFSEFNITVDVIKHKPLSWPRVETATAWIATGYDKDLNKALDILKGETIKLIAEKFKVSTVDAEKIMYRTWNCPIAEVVNGVQGIYCIVPKIKNAPPSAALPREDNPTWFVTWSKEHSIETAMKKASMAMIKKVVKIKKLSPQDAYALLSLAMDCRISAWHSGDREVHCMLPKSLWIN